MKVDTNYILESLNIFKERIKLLESKYLDPPKYKLTQNLDSDIDWLKDHFNRLIDKLNEAQNK